LKHFKVHNICKSAQNVADWTALQDRSLGLDNAE